MKTEKGSMTVYMTLVLLLVSALVCTIVESGRMSAVHTRARSFTYMGIDSVFSEFALPMFSSYGIMGLWMSTDEFTEKFEDYVNGNLDYSDLPYSANADLYGMSLTENELISVKMLTDDNGLIFAEQVYEYMKYYLAEDAAKELLGEMEVFGRSDAVSEFTEKIQEYSQVFTDVEDAVSEIKEKVTSKK